MAAIPTPVQAKKVDDLTTAQFNLIRQSLGINDDPLSPAKTYIIFDAISGNNNLHLDIGASSTYSIIKGDGTVFTQYTDTGGVKVLNYVDAGRYLITIDGVFSGIDTDGAIQSDKDKYISIIGGSNYPLSIVTNAFFNALNLIEAYFPLATSIGDGAFRSTKVTKAYFPLVTSILLDAFRDTNLIEAYFPLATSIGDSAFRITNLIEAYFPLVTSIGVNCFSASPYLSKVHFPLITSIGASAFAVCTNLVDILLGYSLALVSGIGASAFLNVVIKDLQVNSATFDEATSLLIALKTSGLNTISGFRLMYGTDAQDEITVDLGDWDMATNAQLTVPFPVGVTFTNCYDARVYIIDDTSALKLNFEGDFQFNNAPDGQISILASGIQLNRLNTGRFIGGSYDLTPFNRGHCTIRYKR